MNPFSTIKDELSYPKTRPSSSNDYVRKNTSSKQAEYMLDFLNTSKNIKGKYDINICCYTILDNNTLLYLLEKLDSILYFPHFKSDNIYENTVSKLKKMAIHNYIYKGHIIHNNSIYMLFELSNNFVLNNDEEYYILSTIYEITFKKKVFIYNIHHSVFSIFLKYPVMNNLYYGTTIVPLKEICYYKTTNKIASFEQDIGIISKKTHNIEDPQSIIQTIMNYLLDTNISYEEFLNELNIDILDNLSKFLTKEGGHYTTSDIKRFITTIDVNHSDTIEVDELIHSIETTDKKEGLIDLINKESFSSGIYLRILINIHAYNIAKFNKKNKIRNIFVNNIDDIKVLSRHKI